MHHHDCSSPPINSPDSCPIHHVTLSPKKWKTLQTCLLNQVSQDVTGANLPFLLCSSELIIIIIPFFFPYFSRYQLISVFTFI
ncbi:hypothetical protein WN944_009715 [Citrus x changshan-huyou]|uniref:Uncharacterized protein n=1 Tax=Citrus x changshan-huyou TaxID=2935761 RepID=A0AAP0MS83_9ROSI